MSYDYTKSVLKIFKSVKIPKNVSLSKPSKISLSNKSAFSIPAGPKFSCPGATSACKDCYAMRGRHVFRPVQKALIGNWKLFKSYEKRNNVSGMSKLIISSIPSNRKIFRIHESGDFYSQFSVDVWTEVVRNREDVKFWAYTRTFDLNYSKLVRQPNMVLWASTDEFNIKKAKQFVKRYKNSGVKHAYGPWKHEEKIPDRSFICPVTNDKLALRGACEKCLLCVVKHRVNKNVVFLSH